MNTIARRVVFSPYAMMLVLLVFWGSFAGMTKRVLQSMDNFQMQFYVFGIASLLMTVFFFFNGKLKELLGMSPRRILKILLIGVPSYLYYFFYTLSLSKLPAVEASIINYMFPVFITLLAVPINSEKLNIAKLISIILGFAGVVVMISNGNFMTIHFSNLPGDLLALAAAVSWALFSCVGKKNNDDVYIGIYLYTFIGFVLSTVSLFMFSGFTTMKWNVVSDVVWISVTNFILSYFIWLRMLKGNSASLVASLSFFTPFSTLVFITALTGERITVYQFAGLSVILLGMGIQSARRFLSGQETDKI